MNSNAFKAYFELSRPANVAITMASIPVASVIAGAQRSDLKSMVLAALTGGLVAAGANAINDSFDIEIDRINRPDRPIPRGALTVSQSGNFWFLTSLAGVCLNIFLNLHALAIALFAVAMLYLYSAKFKGTVLIGNLVVGLMTGMAFVYGAVAIGHFDRSIVPASFAFLVNVAREVVKDVEDMKGDAQVNAHTLPVRFGVKPALVIATVTLVLLIATTLVVQRMGVYNSIYWYIIVLVDISLAYVVVSMWKNWTPPNLNRLSLILKLSMVAGLIAIFFGSRE